MAMSIQVRTSLRTTCVPRAYHVRTTVRTTVRTEDANVVWNPDIFGHFALVMTSVFESYRVRELLVHQFITGA